MIVSYYTAYMLGDEAEKVGWVADPSPETSPDEVWPIVHAAIPTMDNP